MARPRKNLRPEDYPKLEAMASVGASKATIAKRLDVAATTLDAILKRDRRAAEAFGMGRGQLQSDLVKCLYDAALKGNITAAIYLTKAMCGFTDQPQPQAAESRVQIEVKLPAALTEQQYRKLLDVTPKRALAGGSDAR